MNTSIVKSIANLSAYFFMLAVLVLSTVSILSIWNFFDEDVLWKSFLSIGLLAVIALIVMIADHFLDKPVAPLNSDGTAIQVTQESDVIFRAIRNFTLVILIISVVSLALFGILAIWEVLQGDVVGKSFSSIAIICFSAFIIVLTCLERDSTSASMFNKKDSSKNPPAFMVVVFIILILVVLFALGNLFF